MISVIVPYNKDRGFLQNCIDSIKSQTYKDVELVIAYGDKSVAANFNDGLSRARGEYCKFVTEDDWLPKNSLQDLADGIKDYSWIFADAMQYESDNSYIYKTPAEALMFESNINHNKIHGGTTLYKTEVLREIGGMNEDLWTGEEYEMHLRLFSHGYLPGYVEKVVYCHRLWGGQKSKLLRKNRKDERQKEIRRIQSLYYDKIQQRDANRAHEQARHSSHQFTEAKEADEKSIEIGEEESLRVEETRGKKGQATLNDLLGGPDGGILIHVGADRQQIDQT